MKVDRMAFFQRKTAKSVWAELVRKAALARVQQSKPA